MGLLKSFLHGLSYISGDGWWALDPIHRALIDSVLSTLDIDKANVVRAQLSARYFVQWMSKGRINRIFFQRPDLLPVIGDPAFSSKLFKVQLDLNNQKHTAHVVFYEGRIFSVELKIPRAAYKNREFKVGAVTQGTARDSFTNVIDRAAHGKPTEINP